MFFTARIGPVPVAALRSGADFAATVMTIYLSELRGVEGWEGTALPPDFFSADQFGQLRKVMLFSLAYFSAESSISLRINFGSEAPNQSLVTIWNLLPSHCIMWNLPAPS